MTTNLDLIITAHDPAPAAQLDAADTARREQLLQSVLSGDMAGAPSLATHRRRRAGAAAAAGMAAAVLLAGAGLAAGPFAHLLRDHVGGAANADTLAATDVATWTAQPVALTAADPGASKPKAWCDTALQRAAGAGTPTTYTNVDLRGKVATMIANRASGSFLCLAGSDGTGFWTVIGPSDAAAPSAVTIETGGAHGSGSASFQYLEGSAGADVASITVHAAGESTRASIEGGRWTAWWPWPSMKGALGGTATITLRDGSSRTVSTDSLYSQQ